VEHRDSTRRYLRFIEASMRLSCVGIVVILLVVPVTNLIR
jgi:hypothetical protein